MSLRRSILFPSQHSLKVFTFSFSGFTPDFIRGLFIAHNTTEIIKKINRNKKLQTIKILGKFKLRISLSCFCHQTSVSNKGCVALHLEKYLQLKREVISTLPLCYFRLFFDRRPLWFLFNPSLLQKLLK